MDQLQGSAAPTSLNNSLPIGSRWRGLEITHPELDTAITQLMRWWWLGESRAIILAGNSGSGKTTLAQMMEEWGVNRGYRNHFASEIDLLAEIRRRYNDNSSDMYMQHLKAVGLLILDDVGTAHYNQQQWYESIMWKLLDSGGHQKILITTNLYPKELSERVGSRGSSRLKELVKPGYYCQLFSVPDYRERSRKNEQPIFATV